MFKLDLITTAKNIAEQSGNTANVTVIEKELLHYEILRILDKEGILETLTFQGGTCLRLHRPHFDTNSIPNLFALKVQDYHQAETVIRNKGRIFEIPEIVESNDFLAQMKRFLPTTVFNETIARKLFRESLANEVIELYEMAFA